MPQTTTALSEEAVRELSRTLREPEWLLARRLEAWRAFEAMAMPDGLDEEWRRTDISEFDLDAHLLQFSMAPSAVEVTSNAAEVAKGTGLVVMDLSEAASSHEALLRSHLSSTVLPTEWKLQALAAALRTRGTFVHVPKGLEVALPLTFLVKNGVPGRPDFPHLLILAEEASAVTIIIDSESPDSALQSLCAGAVEIVQRPNSRVRLFDMQRWGEGTYSFMTTRARLEQGAQLVTCNVGLGGRLTKARIEASLEGEGSQADLIGLTFGNQRQHFDYITLQDHLGSKTTSDLLFKAALDGRSSQVWTGTVRIHGGATGSDANQTSRNLLLSGTAKAAPIPVLEIEQYDILRCSHGATAGPVDEEQRFYLESRGIDPAEAERLLVDAFFQEVLDRIPDDAVRERVQVALVAKLEAGGA